ncbi:MAG: hypothetical protein JOZ99_02165 [Actinobacteria bacterium]|nr:hypothetical protein [Actinomycetota bacterium]
MRRATRRHAASAPIVGVARVDSRTKDLVKRLLPGEIAVIDHADLDRVAADALIDAGVAAVVNASPSLTGRYPNGGPLALVDAGVPLVDDVGAELMNELADGATVRVDKGEIWVADELVGKGLVLTRDEVESRMEDARAAIGVELEHFAENTLEYIRREARVAFEPVELPPLRTRFKGRHALVVVRGYDYRSDLRALRHYIREHRPVLIGVDGGADALLEVGLVPEIIIGDFDSVSRRAIDTNAELVHHVHVDGRAPGREALANWGVPYHEFVMDGTSEDVAMILAYEAGAELIVAVGTHATMVEFLDKGRKGMSSTFLTRLRLGPLLVDAKGVNRLYEGRMRRRDIAFLVLAALAAVIAMVWVSPSLHVFLDGIRFTLRDLWRSISNHL